MRNICGVCRKPSGKLISLKFKNEAENILRKLKRFINKSELEVDPHLKGYICLSCKDDLDVAYRLKKRCDKINYRDKRDVLCDVCALLFENYKRLEEHKARHSNKKCLKKPKEEHSCKTSPKYPLKLKISKGEKRKMNQFICHFCNETFLNIPGLKLHLQWHGFKKDLHECPHCDRSYLNRIQLKKHLQYEHDVKK